MGKLEKERANIAIINLERYVRLLKVAVEQNEMEPRHKKLKGIVTLSFEGIDKENTHTTENTF
ncbi:hypothetical protein CSE16_01525 [Solibacillus sp. R5-41]|uniref:hypothetical protein n=1 Tax=Solibacillus sp. R5-41 TaxID=2048654 RepID=UPI000C128AF0|nr:hypothetical protein [Solibacillus sp. R5-41]ATP38799.1 hypothetical protein CSE16_01525 [Solibacillus sp. R5-41]